MLLLSDLLITDILFERVQRYLYINAKYKMDKIIYKFLLAGDKFMFEMDLRQPRLAYRAYGSFTKNFSKNLKKH